MNKLFLIFLIVTTQLVYANTKRVELSIQMEEILLPDNVVVPMYSYGIENEWIKLDINDTLLLVVTNSDSINHTISVGAIDIQLSPNKIDSIVYSKSEMGITFLFDPDYEYLGLKLALISINESSDNFFWTLRSLDSSMNNAVLKDDNINVDQYKPEYFLINRNWGASINNDEYARIVGNVGDSIYLFISNLGLSAHSLHFHGYHAEILISTKFPFHKGRSKDTFPVYSNESLILLLVPDKGGEYPVHDHNLVGTTGGKEYGNGMFTTILINE